jgi:hypothetical protein
MSADKSSFDIIYKYNLWGTGSGTGSLSWNNKEYVRFLQNTLDKYNIKTVVEIACGDYRLWSNIKYQGKYLGIDIVQSVIDNNTKKFGGENKEFINLNVLESPANTNPLLNSPDLVIIKDVFIHLPVSHIITMLESVNKMRPKYVLLCEDSHYSNIEYDVTPGLYHPINFTRLISSQPISQTSYYEMTYLAYISLVLVLSMRISYGFLILLLIWIPKKNVALFTDIQLVRQTQIS